MTKQILRIVLAGILAGAALFMMPFLLVRILVFILLIGAIVKLLGGRRHRFRRGRHYIIAAKINNMTEEERTFFRQKIEHRCGHFNRSKKEQ